MNRTVTPCLSRRLLSACRTCLVKASEMGTFSSLYRSGMTRFLTRVRGVWPSLYRILQTVSVRQTLTRLNSSVRFESSDHCLIVWSLDRCRSTGAPGLAVLTWLMPTGAAIIRSPTISSRWRCLFIPFTYSPAHGYLNVWAGRHGARRLQAQWSAHSCLFPHPMLRSVAA